MVKSVASGKVNNKPRVLALFSGGGGLDLGFALAGFEVGVSSDIVPEFLETIELNKRRYFSASHRTVCADISSADPSVFGKDTVDFMIGGPPCQSFSAAGRRAGGVHGVNDFRGSLFWHYCRLIEHFQPKGFLFENVRGILQANKGEDWAIILEAFNKLGYQISYRVLDAADYGVPQHRERLIVVGLKDKEFLFPRPTYGPASSTRQPYVSTGQALSDLDNPNEEIPPYGGKWGDLLMEIPPGMNYLYFTEEMGHKSPRFAWRSRFSDFLYKLDPSLPSKTIVATQGRYGGPFHWKSRKLTFAEHMRLQSFPDDYEFNGTLLVAIKQLGNSVAPRFAEALGRAVMKQVFGADDPIELMPHDHQLSFDTRKREKAARTKMGRVMSSSTSANQMCLWADKSTAPVCHKDALLDWDYAAPRERLGDSANANKTFRVKATFAEKKWTLHIQERMSARPAKLKLQLAFHKNIERGFDSITVVLNCSTLEYAAVAWDAVDWCVRTCSSFTSIHPLYGHFTEPHPKFDLAVEATDPLHKGLQDFIMKTSSFDFVSRLHPLTDLVQLFPDKSGLGATQYLRHLGWDLRVHQTNRAIPQGFFRSGYPFTVSLFEPRFTTWRDKGTDIHADRTAIPA